MSSIMIYAGPEPDASDNDTNATRALAGSVGAFTPPIGLIQSQSFGGKVQSIDDSGLSDGPDRADLFRFEVGGLTDRLGLGFRIENFDSWQEEVVGSGFAGTSYSITVTLDGLVNDTFSLAVQFGAMKTTYIDISLARTDAALDFLNLSYAAGFGSDVWTDWVPIFNDVNAQFDAWALNAPSGAGDFLARQATILDALDVLLADIRSLATGSLARAHPDIFAALEAYAELTIDMIGDFAEAEYMLDGEVVDLFGHPDLSAVIGIEFFREFATDFNGAETGTIRADIHGQVIRTLTGGGLEAGVLDYGLGFQTAAYRFADLIGTIYDDPLNGRSWGELIDALQGDDTIHGRGGDDTIRAGTGDDWADGGNGDDLMLGGPGEDTLLGGRGDDQIHGGLGHDRLDGGSGHDRMFGNTGDDRMLGRNGRDRMDGGNGDDWISGGGHNDDLTGGFGDDVLEGKAGNDRLRGQKGADQLDGGAGNDTLSGGAHRDEFLFVKTSVGFGKDAITDFQPGVDVIRLQAATGEATDFSGYLAASRQSGSHVIYDFDLDRQNVIILENTRLSDLTLGDIAFF